MVKIANRVEPEIHYWKRFSNNEDLDLSYSVSIASLVVPAILLTIVLFSPRILFINDDFPTFGFPITATFILPQN